jgi:hypothetical protein
MVSCAEHIKYEDWDDVHPVAEAMVELVLTLSAGSNNALTFEPTGVASHPEECVEFLDLDLGIGILEKPDGSHCHIVDISVYDKPTNLHIYTDPSTFYPIHYVYNWIQGENIRLIRNSTSEERYQFSLERFKQFLFRRNYCETKVEHFVALNSFDDRSDLLHGKKPHQQRKGLGTDITNNRFVKIRNEGSRLLFTQGVRILNNLLVNSKATDDRIIPIVTKGKSILSVMNKTKKN